MLELVTALGLARQDGDAQRLELLHNLLPHHAECLVGMAGDENAFPLSKQVADKIRDRVRLTSTRRSLYQHATMLLKPASDPELLLVRRLAEQDPLVLMRSCWQSKGLLDARDAFVQ